MRKKILLLINHGLRNWPSSKIDKQNRNQLYITTDDFLAPSTPSNSYEKLN